MARQDRHGGVTFRPGAVLEEQTDVDADAMALIERPERPWTTAAGVSPAFETLFRSEYARTVRIAYRVVGDQAEAEDVAQEVFLLAFKALPQLQDPTRFSSWLYAIARHRARRVSMQASRLRPTESSVLDRLILANCHEIGVHPVEELVRRAERAYVPELLAKLDANFRIPLRLRYYEEWPVQQISEFLMLPVTTVKWRLHKGRLLMRELLTALRKEQE